MIENYTDISHYSKFVLIYRDSWFNTVVSYCEIVRWTARKVSQLDTIIMAMTLFRFILSSAHDCRNGIFGIKKNASHRIRFLWEKNILWYFTANLNNSQCTNDMDCSSLWNEDVKRFFEKLSIFQPLWEHFYETMNTWILFTLIEKLIPFQGEIGNKKKLQAWNFEVDLHSEIMVNNSYVLIQISFVFLLCTKKDRKRKKKGWSSWSRNSYH